MFKRDNRYFKLGLTLFTVIVGSVIFYLIFNNLSSFYDSVKSFLGIISSVIYGAVFAYIMNPLMKKVEALVQRIFRKSNITERRLKRLSRGIGLTVSLVVFLLIIYGLIASVVPEVIKSLEELLSKSNLENASTSINNWVNNVAKGTPIEAWLKTHNLGEMVQNWITKENNIVNTLSNAFTGVFGIAKSLFNALVGIVIAVYILISKERFQAQAKKLTVAIFSRKHANRVFEIAQLTNRCFGGFMVGKLIDSLIIGVLSYIGMRIIGLPYALLASVFVGITNIIPFFGPLIGIVIGTVLILLQSPLQALWFLIFELALQQIDGNIIGPRILGEKLGISDFWILVSITVFGGLFNFPGMIIGVPVFTVIYTLVSESVNNKLQKKRHPLQTDLYYSIVAVEDLSEYEKEFGEATVFYSEDTFDTEYDPEEDVEYENPDEM